MCLHVAEGGGGPPRARVCCEDTPHSARQPPSSLSATALLQVSRLATAYGYDLQVNDAAAHAARGLRPFTAMLQDRHERAAGQRAGVQWPP